MSKIISKDSWLVAYSGAYLLPFASIVISDYSIIVILVVILVLVLVFISAIMALPNILLYLVGYHFYELETETGVGDYLLISKKRKIRRRDDVKMVMRVFEKLLIETEEDK